MRPSSETARVVACSSLKRPCARMVSTSWARDAQHRIERRHRVLEHHRDAVAAQRAQLIRAHREHVAPLEGDFPPDDPGGLLQQPHQRERRDALAGTRLADNAQRLAGRDRERDAIDGAHDAGIGEELQCASRARRESAYRPPWARGC
jgi:hypothetical protein